MTLKCDLCNKNSPLGLWHHGLTKCCAKCSKARKWVSTEEEMHKVLFSKRRFKAKPVITKHVKRLKKR